MTVRRGISQGFGFGIGCLLLIVAIGVALIYMGSGAQQNAEIGRGLVATLPPAVVTAPAREPTALLDIEGSGIQRTERFTALGDWLIGYTYDCAAFGQAGNFQIYVYTGDGTLVDVAVNALDTEGDGRQPEYKPGTFYLEVTSVCDWHVVVGG